MKEQINHLAWTLGFILLLSTLFVVALPGYGVMGGIHAGAIRGIFVHKNVFSPIVVLSVVIFFLQALEAQRNKWLYWTIFAVSIALGIGTKSSTALALMVVMLFLCICYRIFRWRYEVLVCSLLFILIVGMGATTWLFDFGGADLLFGAVGKDATLSRRTEIWAYVWDSIQQRPWLGYGLGGYWNGINGPSAYVLSAMRIEVHYAHNGFLEICLSLGFIGFALFVLNFVFVAGQSLAVLRNSKTVAGFWPLILLSYIIFTNLTEGGLGNFNTMSWALYSAIVFSFVAIKTNRSYL